MATNTLVEEPEIEQERPRSQLKTKLIAKSFSELFTGNFLTRENTLRFLPFFLFLSLMAIIYIANGYYAEAKIRKLNTLADQLKELRSEFIITKSDLMFISKQSEVAAAAASTGIKESVEPPSKIIIRKKQKELQQ